MAPQEPQQQTPMEATTTINDTVNQQPAIEPQPTTTMRLRGGEEAGCDICCGLFSCQEGCC